jgi:hypothetical protein
MIQNNIYVDNILVPVRAETDIKNICEKMIEMFAEAGMNIREFDSNKASELKFLGEDKLANNMTNKILGLQWDKENDEFFIELRKFEKNLLTRRSMLSFISAVFDPLGIVSPILLPLKIILSDV